jgi:hypothetical protein
MSNVEFQSSRFKSEIPPPHVGGYGDALERQSAALTVRRELLGGDYLGLRAGRFTPGFHMMGFQPLKAAGVLGAADFRQRGQTNPRKFWTKANS